MKKKSIIITITLIVLSGVFYALNGSYFNNPHERKLIGLSTTIDNYFDSAHNEEMIKSGFENTESSKRFKASKTRKMWKNIGLNFYTDDEVEKFLKNNDFILGEASRYIKDVPKGAGEEIISNLCKVRKKILIYTLTLTHDNVSYSLADESVLLKRKNTNWQEDWPKHSTDIITKEAAIEMEIKNSSFWNLTFDPKNVVYVIGAPKDFNKEGMTIDEGILKALPPKDPIAVAKVSGGYIQLAQW